MNREHFTYIKIFCNILFFVISLLLVLYALPKLLVFFMPFVIAWIISCIATPIVRFVERHLKLKRRIGMVCVVVAIIAAVVAVIYGLGAWGIRVFMNFVEDLPMIWSTIRLEAQGTLDLIFSILHKFPGEGPATLESVIANSGDYISQMFSELSAPTISTVGNIAKSLPDIIIYTIMCLLATYFFVVDREEIIQKLNKVVPKSISSLWEIIQNCFVQSIGGYFKAQFKIEVWIYFILVIGLYVLGVNYAIFIAMVIALLDILPVFGTGFVLWPWTVIELVNGQYGKAIGLMLIWGIAQLVRQFIQPKYVGETLGIEPVPTLFLLYAGYKISSVFGMIVAVPLAILVVRLYREGVFQTTEQSIRLLIVRIQKIRHFNQEELEELKKDEKF